MKYFTPELFLRLQDTSKEKSFLAASECWERGIQSYRAHLQSLMGHLPRSVRRLIKEFQLHDADVLAMDRSSRTLSITLNLCPPKSYFLLLTYSLVDEPRINRSALPPRFCSHRPKWLYDELDIEKRSSRSRRPTFAHGALLSNGWEIKVRFSKLLISLREAVFPHPASTGSFPQSA